MLPLRLRFHNLYRCANFSNFLSSTMLSFSDVISMISSTLHRLRSSVSNGKTILEIPVFVGDKTILALSSSQHLTKQFSCGATVVGATVVVVVVSGKTVVATSGIQNLLIAYDRNR